MPRRALISKIFAFLDTLTICFFWTMGRLPPSPCPAFTAATELAAAASARNRGGDFLRTGITVFVLWAIGNVNRKRTEERERDSKKKYHGETVSP